LHEKGLASMQITPCGNFFYTGSQDGIMKQWNLLEKRLHKDYGKIHNASITAIGISPAGNYLMTGSGDKKMKQFEVNDNGVF